MRLTRLATLVILLGTCSAMPARADGFFTPFVGYNFGGDSANCESLTSCQEKHANFGASIGSMGKAFGIEADFGYAKDFFAVTPGADSNVFSATVNLLAGAGAGPVQPYVLAGVGLIRPHVSLNPTQISKDNNALGWDIGGGINVLPLKHIGVRGDVRRFKAFKDVEVLHLGTIVSGVKLEWWRASLGLVLRF